ncbi:acyl-CoA thioesterase [Salipaludibacillus aurantiacus]|uniref:Acyl-CoA thioester hydrolase n=1 Tax=Salipaludibacillus aurantiacus TaxID=1601833 RepID=A0A1H9T1Z2_9BACI|nr:acyl-CoA thioesterase [Salipaludibacillus aurantiacus]SER91097.1 acyl-CoA thioester hydrolase [Salipaludibacillus aurantiacus]
MKLPEYIKDFEVWENDFRYYYPVTVRFSETDAFGHLNNTVPFVYFEHARIQFFKECGLMAYWMDKRGETIPVTADLHCDYLKQVFFDEPLQIGIKVSEIGRSSVEIHYAIKNEDGEVCVTGRGRIVQVSKETGKSVSWDMQSVESLKKGASVCLR